MMQCRSVAGLLLSTASRLGSTPSRLSASSYPFLKTNLHYQAFTPSVRLIMTSEIKSAVSKTHFGFMGSGNMSQAMVKGFLSSGAIKGSQVTMTDIIPPTATEAFKSIKELVDGQKVEYLQSNSKMAAKCDVIFACLKPHLLLHALGEISGELKNKLVVSIAAGLTIDQLKAAVHPTTHVVRVMPNTPCLVQNGTAIFTRCKDTIQAEVDLVECVSRAVFTVFEEIPESMFNAATAVSGCGPAYAFIIAEALADGGVRMGVPRALAQKLAVNTLLGAAKMMQETGRDPAVLKNEVCSPGGATIAGVHALEAGGLRNTLMNAVQAAAIRGKQLAD